MLDIDRRARARARPGSRWPTACVWRSPSSCPTATAPGRSVLEALPYRKDDLTASYRGEYRRLADEGGFAVARVDLRGTGSSEGIATDEYPPEEQTDLAEVIAWLAAQPWSNGRVGMYGTSYSGFNSLQLAAERPPALKAICAIYATDDCYTDDVHYMGGSLRALDLVDYPTYMTACQRAAAGPRRLRRRVARGVATAGRRHRAVAAPVADRAGGLAVLAQGLAAGGHPAPGVRPGLRPHRGATMLVAGWADGYRNNTFRTFERLPVPSACWPGRGATCPPPRRCPDPTSTSFPR